MMLHFEDSVVAPISLKQLHMEGKVHQGLAGLLLLNLACHTSYHLASAKLISMLFLKLS